MNKPNIKQQPRRTFSALAVLGILAVGALFTLPSAKAGPPVNISGTFTGCGGVPTVTQVGPNLLLTVDGIDTYTPGPTAPFDGTMERTEQDVIYPDGSATTHFSGVFSGSISGRSGTVVMTGSGTVSASGTVLINWVIDQGTGDLAGAHGNGTWYNVIQIGHTEDCDDTVILSYNGQIDILAAVTGATPTQTRPIRLRAAGNLYGVLLTWRGATSDNIDIYNFGALIATVPNTGTYFDNLCDSPNNFDEPLLFPFNYHVCEAGTATCSNNVRGGHGPCP